MAIVREKTVTGKILENVLFLAEVFGDNSETKIQMCPCLQWQDALSFRISNFDGLTGVVGKTGRYGNRCM